MSLMVFLFVISQVGEIQNEWLQELYKVSLGLVGHALIIHSFKDVVFPLITVRLNSLLAVSHISV